MRYKHKKGCPVTKTADTDSQQGNPFFISGVIPLLTEKLAHANIKLVDANLFPRGVSA